MISKHYQRFFIFTLEKPYCKQKKIEILIDVFANFNSRKIFKELEYYTRYPQLQVAISAVRAIGTIGLRYPQYSGKTTKILTKICKRKQKKLVSQAVLSLTEYFYLVISFIKSILKLIGFRQIFTDLGVLREEDQNYPGLQHKAEYFGTFVQYMRENSFLVC